MSGYYCASNSTCQAQKAAGTACAATAECGTGLTCLDGVCCMSSACPACRNCGATGTCAVVVAGANDASGTACSGTRSCNASGTCLLVNGQGCGSSGSSCASGNCLDGVCCSVASCGACRNCGSHGTCEIAVTNADDASGLACGADQSCDGTGVCKARWALVGKVSAGEAPRDYFSTGVGNYLYFANANNEGSMAQYFKSFNVATATFADETLTGNPFCDCGYEGTVVGQPLNNRIYYAANTSDDKYYVAGAAAWTTFPGGYPAPRGELATAVLGRRIYWVGGRGGLSSVQAYDTTTDTWITSGIATAPMGFNSGCAGANAGVVYVFGGSLGSSVMMAYTEATNTWTTLTAPPPAGCYYRNLPTWRGKLMMASGNGLEAFNTSTQSGIRPCPSPPRAASGSPWWRGPRTTFTCSAGPAVPFTSTNGSSTDVTGGAVRVITNAVGALGRVRFCPDEVRFACARPAHRPRRPARRVRVRCIDDGLRHP